MQGVNPTACIVLLSAAYLTSTISGFLGMAGGMSLLAVMTAVLPASQVVPVHGVVQLASNFTRTLVYLRYVYWTLFLVYAVPVVGGVTVATLLWSGDELGWFRPGIGVFILLFLIWQRRSPAIRNLPLWTYAPLGLVVGFLAIFVGATGPFIAPFFLRDDFSKEQVIATKAVCIAWGHVLKIPAFLTLGFNFLAHWPLLGALLVCVVIGTLTGRAILGRFSSKAFIMVYQTVLATIALYLILSSAL